MGSAPQPVAFDHFPGRLQAVVWRNWQLVRPSVLARVLWTNEDRITQLAASMGLPPAEDVPPGLARRAYITVLRRNWHLLPYEQLLPLIGMSRVELAYSLREDDFLFVKLGNLKPQCRPLQLRRARRRGHGAGRRDQGDRRVPVRRRRPAVVASPGSRSSTGSHRSPTVISLRHDGRTTVRGIFIPTLAAMATPWRTTPPTRIPTACWRGSPSAESTASGCTSS